jgi:hypothetical protein
MTGACVLLGFHRFLSMRTFTGITGLALPFLYQSHFLAGRKLDALMPYSVLFGTVVGIIIKLLSVLL